MISLGSLFAENEEDAKSTASSTIFESELERFWNKDEVTADTLPPPISIVKPAVITLVENGDVAILSDYLKINPSFINERDIYGKTALICACHKGFTEAVKILLECPEEQCLVDYQEHKHLKSRRDNTGNFVQFGGWSALMYAAKEGHEQCVKLLLEHGCSINATDSTGKTALILSVINNHASCVAHLSKDSDINYRDVENLTALMYAARSGLLLIVEELLWAGANSLLEDSTGFSALHYAESNGHNDVASVLNYHKRYIAIAGEEFGNKLCMLAFYGRITEINVLLAYPSNMHLLNTPTKTGVTPLMLAAGNNHQDVVRTFLSHDDSKSLAKILDCNCWNALFHAVANNAIDCVILLLQLESSAPLTLKDKNSLSLMDYAAAMGYDVILRKLLHGLDGNTESWLNFFRDNTAGSEIISQAVELAAMSGYINCAVELFEVCAFLKADDLIIKSIACLIASMRGHDVFLNDLFNLYSPENYIDVDGGDGHTALIKAAQYGNHSCVAVLLKFNASITCVDIRHNRNALMHAAISGDGKCVERILNRAIEINHFKYIDLIDCDGNSAVMLASCYGNLSSLKALLDARCNAATINFNNCSASSLACICGHVKCLQLLLHYELQNEIKHKKEAISPLLHAASTGNSKCLNTLIAWKNPLDDKNLDTGNTALICAASFDQSDCLNSLASWGASMDSSNNDGMTALATACMKGNDKCVEVLLRFIASRVQVDINNWTALMHASTYGNGSSTPQSSESIPQGIDYHLFPRGQVKPMFQKNRFNALHYCATKGYHNCVFSLVRYYGYIIDEVDKYGNTALMFACMNGRFLSVKTLLLYGADVNIQNVFGVTALMYACYYSHRESKENSLEIYVKIISELLKPHCNLKLKDVNRRTAKSYARGNRHIVELLQEARKKSQSYFNSENFLINKLRLSVESIAGIRNHKDPAMNFELIVNVSKGNSVYPYKNSEEVINNPTKAGMKITGHPKIHPTDKSNDQHREDPFRTLQNEIKEINTQTLFTRSETNRRPSLFVSRKNLTLHDKKDFEKILLTDEFVTRLYMIAARSGSSKLLIEFVKHSKGINFRNSRGQTPLFISVFHGFSECVQILLENQADPNIVSYSGCSCLMEAARHGFSRCIKLLIAFGARVSTKDRDGRTAMMLAARNSHTKCIRNLLGGMDKCDAYNQIFDQDNDGRTALMLATERSHIDVVSMSIFSPTVNMVDNAGWTAIMFAASNADVVCLNILLLRGSQSSVKSFCGVSALEIAIIFADFFGKPAVDNAARFSDLKASIFSLVHNIPRSFNEDKLDVVEKSILCHKYELTILALTPIADIVKDLAPSIIHDGNAHNQILNDHKLTRERETLLDACTTGNLESVKAILQVWGSVVPIEQKPKLLCPPSRSKNPLINAVIMGHLNCVVTLIAEGAPISVGDELNKSPIIYAIEYGHDECLSALFPRVGEFRAGKSSISDNNEVSSQSNKTIIFSDDSFRHKKSIGIEKFSIDDAEDCVHAEILRGNALLLAEASRSWTPLIYAAAYGRHKCVGTVLKLYEHYGIHNSEANRQDIFGRTALMIACMNNFRYCVSDLLEKDYVDFYAKDNLGLTASMYAALFGNIECIQAIYSKVPVNYRKHFGNITDNNGRTALAYAATSGHSESVQFFIENEADPELCDDYGHSPLMSACWNGHVDVVTTLLTVDLTPCKQKHFLQSYASWTALMFASKRGFSNCVEIIINIPDNALNRDIRDFQGRNALAFSLSQGNVTISRLLRSAGAREPEILNNKCAPEVSVKGHIKCIELLLKDGKYLREQNSFQALVQAVKHKAYIKSVKTLVVNNCEFKIGDQNIFLKLKNDPFMTKVILDGILSDSAEDKIKWIHILLPVIKDLNYPLKMFFNSFFEDPSTNKGLWLGLFRSLDDRRLIYHLVCLIALLKVAGYCHPVDSKDCFDRIEPLNKLIRQCISLDVLDDKKNMILCLAATEDPNSAIDINSLVSEEIDMIESIKVLKYGSLIASIEYKLLALGSSQSILSIISDILFGCIQPKIERKRNSYSPVYFYRDLCCRLRYCPVAMFAFEGISKCCLLVLIYVVSVHVYTVNGSENGPRYSFESFRDANGNIITILTRIQVILLVLFEIGQLIERDWKFEKYSGFIWNSFDLCGLLFCLIWSCLQTAAYEPAFLFARCILALAAIPYSLLLLRYLSCEEKMGELVIMIFAMVKELLPICLLFVISAFGFVIYYSSFFNYLIDYDGIGNAYIFVFNMSQNNFNWYDFRGVYYTPTVIATLCCSLWVSTLLVNFCVARMNASLERVKLDVREKWVLSMARNTKEFLRFEEANPLSMLPAPFNLLTILLFPFHICMLMNTPTGNHCCISLCGTISDLYISLLTLVPAVIMDCIKSPLCSPACFDFYLNGDTYFRNRTDIINQNSNDAYATEQGMVKIQNDKTQSSSFQDNSTFKYIEGILIKFVQFSYGNLFLYPVMLLLRLPLDVIFQFFVVIITSFKNPVLVQSTTDKNSFFNLSAPLYYDDSYRSPKTRISNHYTSSRKKVVAEETSFENFRLFARQSDKETFFENLVDELRPDYKMREFQIKMLNEFKIAQPFVTKSD